MAANEHAAAAPGDSVFGRGGLQRSLGRRLPVRFIGWRLRALVLVALLGCVGTFTLMRWLATSPAIDAGFGIGPGGTLLLTGGPGASLSGLAGQSLAALVSRSGDRIALDATTLRRSPRWEPDDARRRDIVQHQERIAAALAGGSVTLLFADGRQVDVATPARGYTGLGLLFAPLALLALALVLIGTIVVLVRPQPRNLLFLLMALAQAGNLVFIAIESMRGLGLPAGATAAEMLPRIGFDLVTSAAAVHAFALHPRRLPHARLIAGVGWSIAALIFALALADQLVPLWAWAQTTVVALAIAAVGLLQASHAIEPNPFAAVLRRLGVVAVGTLLLISVGVAAATADGGMQDTVAVLGSAIWTVFFASLLLLVPFLSKSKQLLREFALLAGISTVATSLDLLFAAIFSVGQFTSLTLAVFFAVGVYAAARQWLLNQIIGSSVPTTERTFEQLYRVAREVQDRPAQHATLLLQLLRDLFDPLEALPVQRAASRARVVGGGSALVVPVRAAAPGSAEDPAQPPLSLVLRFARRGKRLFTSDDARLAERVVEQLRRAVEYDQAVERGRSEERLRIAQDLHDDIGARLLTLIYKAQSPEMEDYVRHTLQDLKTLTRGLAASEHRLSFAATEWKADLTQRLSAARVRLSWSFEYERDVRLSVVQWSALTRVLRELTSNAIMHAHASRLDISFSLVGRLLLLSVADDGDGRDPQSWSHGLGLGGVRKRVKLLGGDVRWRDNVPRGIVCELRIADFATRPVAAER